jgi:SNF2 family DNA or RNA helicase
MKIGDAVRSPAYNDLDQGRIINILSFDGANFYEIYFPKSKETLTLEEKDVFKVVTPLEKLNSGQFDALPIFKLRILSEKISAFLYQDKIVAANNFKIVPLPHQVLAVNQIMEQFMPRSLIADEVGLGKTIEASLIFEELKLRRMVKRIIIITPAGLTSQWKDELKTKFNEDFTIIDRNTFETLRQIHGDVNVWKNYDRVITSLDFLKPKAIRDSLSEQVRRNRADHNQAVTDGCINANWDMVIFDEAHKLSKEAEGSETSRYKIG